MNKKFSIEMCSDLDFEGMVIDISYEKGIDNMEIEIRPILDKLIFSLGDFFVALEKAKQLAIKCAKEDELRKH